MTKKPKKPNDAQAAQDEAERRAFNAVNSSPEAAGAVKKEREVQGLGGVVYDIRLRDLFAMAALIGILCRGEEVDVVDVENTSYTFADAMLAAREKK